MNHRRTRIGALVVRYITEIIQFELKNPKLGFVTITGGKVSPDNSFVKIYVSFIDGKNVEARMDELTKSKGFVRSELAKRLSIYKVPDIAFVYDDSHDKAKRVEEALAKEKAWLEKK